MNLTLRFNTLTRYLIPLSLFYLALAQVIFFVGWLKWYLALFCVALVVLPLFTSIREIDQIVGLEQKQPDRALFGVHHIILVILVSALLLSVSGIGGYGYQDTDWLKHNAILKDLIEQPWPVVYEFGGQDVPLVYYVACYLPAALVGKLGGWSLANQALLVWSWIGLVLAVLWFLVLNRRVAFTVVLLFVMFSGLDVIGQLISRSIVVALRPEVAQVLRWDHIEQWSIGWQYSSNATLLFWVPNQALSGWIVSGLLTYTILRSLQRRYSLFYCSLVVLWSPFVTVGLFPYLLVEFLLQDGTLVKRLKRYVSVPNFCGLVLLMVIGLFYSAKLYPVSPLLTSDIPSGFSLSFAPDNEAKAIGLVMILVFCLLEFGLYGILVYSINQDWNVKAKALLVTTLICLSLLPFFRYGGSNDFVMRVSIPALFVLAVFLGQALHNQSPDVLKRIMLMVLVILGSVTALVEFRRHIVGIRDAGTILQTPSVSQVMSVNEWGILTEKDAAIILQYVGSSQAPFFELMAKEP
jgi:hypothetical protein